LTIRHPSVVEWSVWSPVAKPRSGFSSTPGALDIDSTPPTSTHEASPHSINRLACIAASSEEPHSRLTVVPGMLVGSPARSAAIRATLRLSSPAWLASPKITSSIRPGSRSECLDNSAETACAARSSGRTSASAPP
jgi:hypothetical protein